LLTLSRLLSCILFLQGLNLYLSPYFIAYAYAGEAFQRKEK
jgi:hypothetical protein